MGNMCSSSGSPPKKSRGKRPAVGKKTKEKPSAAVLPSLGGNRKTKKKSLVVEQQQANPLRIQGDSELSSIEGSGSQNQPASSGRTKSINKGPAAPVALPQTAAVSSTVPKDFEQLSAAKLGLIRGWIDVIDKKELLDPQDVAGHQRRISLASANGKRASILESVRKAEITEQPNAANGSMVVEREVNEDDADESRLLQ